MKTSRATILAACTFVFALLVGCQQPTSPTTAPREKETDIRIRTPGADIDIHGKGKADGSGKDRKIDVDVNRKDR